MVRPPEGCRFSPRCPFATELCTTTPPLLQIAPGREVACWGYAAAVPGALEGVPDNATLPDLGDNAAPVEPVKEVAR
jgi:peptide/nickel transport system ATP-binding protein